MHTRTGWHINTMKQVKDHRFYMKVQKNPFYTLFVKEENSVQETIKIFRNGFHQRQCRGLGASEISSRSPRRTIYGVISIQAFSRASFGESRDLLLIAHEFCSRIWQTANFVWDLVCSRNAGLTFSQHLFLQRNVN